jgi:hypothetical protein
LINTHPKDHAHEGKQASRKEKWTKTEVVKRVLASVRFFEIDDHVTSCLVDERLQ